MSDLTAPAGEHNDQLCVYMYFTHSHSNFHPPLISHHPISGLGLVLTTPPEELRPGWVLSGVPEA